MSASPLGAYNESMFRNPVYDMIVVVPALLIAGLISLFIMTSPARAEDTGAAEPVPVYTGMGRTTFPDLAQRTITVDRHSLSKNATTTERTALSINASDALEAYAVSTILTDHKIQAISLSGDEITVTYRQNGKLLGVLPIALPRTATVHNDGSVSLGLPIYGALTLERDRMQTALEVRARTLLNSEGYLASTPLSPSTQAELLDIIRELIG